MNRILSRLSLVALTAVVLSAALPAQAEWQGLPNRAPNMSVHVTDSSGQKILLGTNEAGVWYTADGGTNWEPFSSRMAPGQWVTLTNGFALDAQADTLLACIYSPDGVKGMRSFDGGGTWQDFLTNIYDTQAFQVMRSQHNQWISISYSQFTRSTDYGLTWQEMGNAEGRPWELGSLYQDPAHDNTLFLTASVYSGEPSDDHNVLYRSDNLGIRWASLLNVHDLFGVTSWAGARDVIRLSNGSLAVSLLTGNPGWPAQGDIIVSPDDGTTWTRLQTLPVGFAPDKILEDVGYPGRLFLSGTCRGGLLRSDNFGLTWTDALSGLPDSVVWSRDLYRNPAGGAISVLVNGNDIFRSVDHGETWQRVNPLPVGGSYSSLSIFSDAVECYTRYENGRDRQWTLELPYSQWREIVSSIMFGDSIQRIGPILAKTGLQLTALARTSSEVGPYGARVSMASSSDDGSRWTFGPSIPFGLSQSGVDVFHNDTLTRFIARSWIAGDSIYYSEDLGQNWHDATPSGAADQYIYAIAQTSHDFFVLTGDFTLISASLHRTSNHGGDWQTLDPGVGFEPAMVAVSEEIFAIRSSDYRIRHFANGVGDDRGVVPVERSDYPYLTAIPGPIPRLVAISEQSSVLYVSDDGGFTWNAHAIELPFPGQSRVTYGLSADSFRNRLWANTGIGPCWIDLGELAAGDEPLHFKPADFTLLKCYPNPFNNEARIIYDLEKSGRVKLDLYNLEGRLVRTLSDDVQEVGRHELRFDGSGLASGTYFLKLKTPVLEKTEKILLLK